MKFMKYHKNNGKLSIGTKNYRVCLFTRDSCGCFEIGGQRKLHFGRWA